MTFNFIEFFTGQVPPAPSQEVTRNNLRGEAIVDEVIRPGEPGRVRFQGSWWFAQCDQGWTLMPGQRVQVVGLDNITLVVEPITNQVLQLA